MSGDSRVRISGGGGISAVDNARALDANSTRAGDFSEPRTVGGEEVHLTKAGAAAYDALLREGASFKAEQDPGFLRRFFAGDLLAGKEEHSGRTK
ncbi:MAG: hypothetical protein Q8O67_33955 [Deltaproteobacteria bacterium]|nr:hypothetical protein [Deltaproteobacteria bacterium]